MITTEKHEFRNRTAPKWRAPRAGNAEHGERVLLAECLSVTEAQRAGSAPKRCADLSRIRSEALMCSN